MKHLDGNMGHSKHRTMGHAGPSGFNKFLVNKAMQEQAPKKKRQKMYDRLTDLMKDRK